MNPHTTTVAVDNETKKERTRDGNEKDEQGPEKMRRLDEVSTKEVFPLDMESRSCPPTCKHGDVSDPSMRAKVVRLDCRLLSELQMAVGIRRQLDRDRLEDKALCETIERCSTRFWDDSQGGWLKRSHVRASSGKEMG